MLKTFAMKAEEHVDLGKVTYKNENSDNLMTYRRRELCGETLSEASCALGV